MTDTDNSTQSPLTVMNASELVLSIIGDMPRLGQVRPLLERVAALIAYKRSGATVNVALGFMEIAGMKMDTIVPGIKVMMDTANADAQQWARDLFELTNRESDSAALDAALVTASELAEQNLVKTKAIQVRERVGALRTWYFPEAPAKEKGRIESWLQGARALAEKPVFGARTAEAPAATLPDWKTPPRLDDQDPGVAALLSQVKLLEDTKDFAGNRTAALQALANLHYPDTKIKVILDACDAICDEQIVQSDTISALAETDKQRFALRANNIAAVRAVANEAQDYLDSRKK